MSKHTEAQMPAPHARHRRAQAALCALRLLLVHSHLLVQVHSKLCHGQPANQAVEVPACAAMQNPTPMGAHLPGIREGATENSTVVTELLASIVSRGVDPKR